MSGAECGQRYMASSSPRLRVRMAGEEKTSEDPGVCVCVSVSVCRDLSCLGRDRVVRGWWAGKASGMGAGAGDNSEIVVSVVCTSILLTLELDALIH